jgi:hypothetical protein
MSDAIGDVLDEVLTLKASAKSARLDGDWQGALEDLDTAVSLIQGHLADAAPLDAEKLRAELADALGSVGGIYRRWGLLSGGSKRKDLLSRSVTAYDAGYQLEANLHMGGAVSYNLVNRLVGRALLDPDSLNPEDPRHEELLVELQQAERVVTDQISGPRQRDPWAFCDLCTLKLLLGDDEAITALHALKRLRPPSFVYSSLLSTLEPIASAVDGHHLLLARIVSEVAALAGLTD